MENFTSWAELLTLPGVTAVTLLVVQYAKGWLDKLVHVPTRLVTYAVALLLMLGATFFVGDWSAESATMCLINVAIAACAAMGVYEQLPVAKGLGGE